nr:hypothetical protein [Tanacetum cinerariifolium]
MEDEKEKVELKQLMKTIPDEEELAIDAIPLAVKSPRIIDWKIYKEGKKSIDAIDVGEEITLVSFQDEVVSNDVNKEMFYVDVLGGEELAERLQAQEQEELSDAEKATLFQQLLEKRRKHFIAKRAEEKRNKPSTQAQQRKIMCTYLKNMEGYKLKDLKLKEFDRIQEIVQDEVVSNDVNKEMFYVDVLGGEEDKGKGIIIEEHMKPKKKDQTGLDEEAAKKLQSEFDEEERLAREKAKKEERANIALIEE